jgi:seryl-tRNA synthetase
MLDLNFVRDNLPRVEEMLRQRGADPAAVLKNFREVDSQRRNAISEDEKAKARRNTLIEEFQLLKKEEKQLRSEGREVLVNEQARTKNLEEQAQIKKSMPRLEAAVGDFNSRLLEIISGIPNMPHKSVPIGHSAEENAEVRRWDPRRKEYISREEWEGNPPKYDFTPRPHWELGLGLGVLDLERAVKLTGARFAVYWDLGAKLERALANFMLDLHTREHGYTEVLPPYLVNSDSMYGTGQLPKFAADSFRVPTSGFEPNLHHVPRIDERVVATGLNGVFRVVSMDPTSRTVELRLEGTNFVETIRPPWSALSYERDLWLIPTSEVPVTNLYRDEILEAARLPISLTAYTPCFRSEAGSYGKDVRGIIRQHQFQKVELVKVSRPENSYEEHEKLTRNAETVLQKLGLHYRTVTLCTGDMGAAAAKTYDIEVWLPGQQLFREISSCSNFESYQARRANIRYRPEGKNKTEFVHTLNGSGLAVGRTWVAIVENYQQADGSVVIPEALRPYVGAERITRKSF